MAGVFAGKAALVTGASSGIGRATAQRDEMLLQPTRVFSATR
jgi:NADP-dependent 3-hydroxy acid dehydrogenase YdfG